MFSTKDLKFPLSLVAAGLMFASLVMPVFAADPPTATGDIVAVAQQAGRFNTFLKLVDAAGLTKTLQKGEYTVFAPTDDAFGKLAAGTVDNWLKPANKAELVALVKYHVVERSLPASMFAKTVSTTHEVNTLDKRRLAFTQDTTGVTVNGSAKVEEADIKASNGVIHAIDTVLTPSSR